MFIDGRWYTETELAAYVISLKADNERVVEANKKLSGMYWEQMNKNIEQKKKIEELEAKHWDECRQIAQYDDDLKRLFNEMLDFLNGMSESAKRFSRILRANADPYKQPEKSPAPKVEHINCKCNGILIDAVTVTKEMIDKATKKATMNTGDFFNRDGLLVCGKCRLPKECEIELFGKMQTVPCLCGCVATEVKTSEVSE